MATRLYAVMSDPERLKTLETAIRALDAVDQQRGSAFGSIIDRDSLEGLLCDDLVDVLIIDAGSIGAPSDSVDAQGDSAPAEGRWNVGRDELEHIRGEYPLVPILALGVSLDRLVVQELVDAGMIWDFCPLQVGCGPQLQVALARALAEGDRRRLRSGGVAALRPLIYGEASLAIEAPMRSFRAQLRVQLRDVLAVVREGYEARAGAPVSEATKEECRLAEAGVDEAVHLGLEAIVGAILSGLTPMLEQTDAPRRPPEEVGIILVQRKGRSDSQSCARRILETARKLEARPRLNAGHLASFPLESPSVEPVLPGFRL